MEVWVGRGLETEELAAQGTEVDVEFTLGRRAVGEGFGKEGVVGWDVVGRRGGLSGSVGIDRRGGRCGC